MFELVAGVVGGLELLLVGGGGELELAAEFLDHEGGLLADEAGGCGG